MSELIIDTDAVHRNWTVLGKDGADSFTKTTDNIVLLQSFRNPPLPE